MEKDWQLLYSTNIIHEAELIKNLLEHNDIDSIIMNKKDSFYVSVGDVEVYVQRDDLIKAKFVIDNNKDE